jgi:hypothetical protein
MKTQTTRTLLVALAIFGIASPAFSQTMTNGLITGIRTGWNADSFAIETAEPIVNPAHCSTPDGYISEKSKPGYNTYYSAALNAFTWSPRVVVTVHNSACYAGRPVLIGINLKSNPRQVVDLSASC